MHQSPLIGLGEFRPALRGVGVTHIKIAIHEVVNHFDRVLNFELPHRPFPEIL